MRQVSSESGAAGGLTPEYRRYAITYAGRARFRDRWRGDLIAIGFVELVAAGAIVWAIWHVVH
jgi:hypothetical protein